MGEINIYTLKVAKAKTIGFFGVFLEVSDDFS